MLGEFFAAGEDEIDATLVTEGPFERFETIEAKTINSVSIATLGEIVGAGTYDELFDRADAEARQSDDGGSGIDAVLPQIQQALAEATDLDSLARRWGATDELADWWRPDDVLAVVRELADMSRRAQSDGRRLWFWWSF
jgi:hypothetical protein